MEDDKSHQPQTGNIPKKVSLQDFYHLLTEYHPQRKPGKSQRPFCYYGRAEEEMALDGTHPKDGASNHTQGCVNMDARWETVTKKTKRDVEEDNQERATGGGLVLGPPSNSGER